MSKRARPFIIQSLEARVFLAADPIGPIQPILSDSGPAIRATLAAVPSGWTAGDIGAPAVAGSSDFNGATWSVAGGGTDIWNASDQFQFVSRSLEGDGAIIVRVASITNTSQYAKAGVMIRNGTAANAAFADLVVTSSQSVTFQWRATAGASAQAIYVNGIVSAPIWLQINRTASLFTASYSYDGALWLQAGTGQSISMNSTARAGLAVSAVNSGALNTATFTNVSLTPNNWLDSDIGSPALAGSSTFDASTWTLSAGGTGIGGTSDSFNFANQTYVGDVTLIARVDSLTNTAAGAEAGLMIRDGAAANAGVALVAIAPSGAVSFDYRTSAGAASASGGTIADIGASRWLKLARSGNSFTAFYSQNGTTWNPIGTSRTIVMNKTINLGIVAAAGTNAARTTATFSRVSVLPGGWEDADIGAPAQAGSATFDGLTWTIRGGGGDIWSDQQQFNFAHQRYVGDFTITTRVRSLQSTGVFAKSGIMIRERPGTNSPYAFVFLTPSSVNFEYRNAASGASTGGGSVAGVGAPTFLKLVRTGNTFRAYYSNDGAAWTQIGAGINLTMGAAVCTGLAVGANDAAKLNAATFTDTSVTAAGVDLFLKTNGRNIRTAHGTGDIVRLRGVNLGGWLLHEAWMDPMDNSGLPDDVSLRNTLESRFGEATADRVIATYASNWITLQDLDNIKAAGLNMIRVPFSYRTLMDASFNWRADAFTQMDWVINEAWKRGLYTVLDFHGVPGGASSFQSSGVNGGGAFWSNSTYQDRAVEIWQRIAQRYTGNPAIAAYDLINEPNATPSSSALWNMYNRMYTTIRAADPDHTVQMEGNWDWNSLPNPNNFGWTNIVYHTHAYVFNSDGSEPTLAQLQGQVNWQVADYNNHASWNVPSYVGEFNMNSSAAAWNYAIDSFNNNGMSWTPWSYKLNNWVGNSWGLYEIQSQWPWVPNVQTDSAANIMSAYGTIRTAGRYVINPLQRNAIGMPGTTSDSYALTRGQTLSITSTNGVLSNDFDVNLGQSGIALSATLVNNVAHGTLTLAVNGSFTYTPAAGFVGTDTFRYKVHDGHQDSAKFETVSLIVTAPSVLTPFIPPIVIARNAIHDLVDDRDARPAAATIVDTAAGNPLAITPLH